MAFDPNAAATNDSGVFGLPFSEEEARVVLVGVPFDATTSYRKGASNGPQAIFEASKQVDLFDRETGRPYEAGIYMYADADRVRSWNNEANKYAEKVIEVGGDVAGDAQLEDALGRVNSLCEQVNQWVYDETHRLLKLGKIPCVIGGDHATPFGAIRAYSEAYPELSVLHFDAHADLRVAFEGFTYSHASIMHNVLTRIPDIARLVQVGIRDFCEDEFSAIQNSGGKIQTFFDTEIHRSLFSGESFDSVATRVVDTLGSHVYISFDIDALDPSLCPHTGTPVPGGLSFAQATYMIGKLVERGKTIVGFDVNEVAPGADDDWDANVGARMVYKLIGWMLRSQAAKK